MFLQKHHSVPESVKIIYNSVTGRWAAMIFSSILFPLVKQPCMLAIFNIFTLFLFAFSVYVLFTGILSHISSSSAETKSIIPKTALILYSFMFTAFFFFLSSGNGEIWFWFSSIPQYIYGIIAFLFGTGMILRHKNGFLNYMLIIITFSYAGGAFEGFAIIFLLIGVFIYHRGTKTQRFFKMRSLRLSVSVVDKTAMLILLSALAVNLIAPGNTIRASWLPERNIIHRNNNDDENNLSYRY